MDIQVNYLAVFLAAVVTMVIGFAWYGPMLFGKPWMKLMGYTGKPSKKDMEGMNMMYGISFVLAMLTAYILSHVMTMSENMFHYSRISTGLSSAFWMWLGFIMPTQATTTIFSKEKSWGLFFINTTYQLATLLAMGLVLGMI